MTEGSSLYCQWHCFLFTYNFSLVSEQDFTQPLNATSLLMSRFLYMLCAWRRKWGRGGVLSESLLHQVRNPDRYSCFTTVTLILSWLLLEVSETHFFWDTQCGWFLRHTSGRVSISMPWCVSQKPPSGLPWVFGGYLGLTWVILCTKISCSGPGAPGPIQDSCLS